MSKKIPLFLFICLLSGSIFPLVATADRGMVPIKPQVKLWETDQNAIVAWNGEEEILVLSVNLKASEKTEVLSLLPLPSNPIKIEEESLETFQKLIDLLNKKLPPVPQLDRGIEKGGIEQPPAILTFHEKIGAHDISVIKINDLDGFLKWDYLSQIGIKPEQIDEGFRLALKNYMLRGIDYFSFDKIEVGNKDVSVNPILYRFKSDYFYYPIKLTAFSATAKNAESASDKVHLFTITKNPIKDSLDIFHLRYPAWSYSQNIVFSLDELKNVSGKIAQLFKGDVYVSELRYVGNLAKTTDDIIMYPAEIWKNNLRLGIKSNDVVSLQKILINEGLWESDYNATGYFGPVTKKAVIKFQEKYSSSILQPLNLKAGTGFVGLFTRNFLKKFQMQ